jgi:transcriptional regulator with XRE-family HTH domain
MKRTPELSRTLARRVKRRRQQLSMSQVALAEAIGVGQATISEIEAAKHEARLSTIERLAKVMRCSPIALLS